MAEPEKVLFSTEFPSTEAAILPEYFRGVNLGGMIPGEIVYPTGNALTYDIGTHQIFVKTKLEIDADSKQPTYFGSRTGIMRIYEKVGDNMVDGYIADLRHLRPGDLLGTVIDLPEDAPEFDQEYASALIEDEGIHPLLAVVFTDPDGNPHLVGDRSLELYVTQLMSAVDAAAVPKHRYC